MEVNEQIYVILSGQLISLVSCVLFHPEALVAEVLNALLEKGSTCRHALQLYDNLKARFCSE